jgi:hypothetical protein
MQPCAESQKLPPPRLIERALHCAGMKTFALLTVVLLATLGCAAQPGAPAARTLWVYKNGKFNWNGDWSFGVESVKYTDTVGVAPEGRHDIAIKGHQWGGWQPFVSADCQHDHRQCFDITPFKFLVFSAKATVQHQTFQVAFMSSGDTADGSAIMVTPYCTGGAEPAIGEWQQCKIPLSSFKLSDTSILKFFIQDHTGLAANKWYLDAVGFTLD